MNSDTCQVADLHSPGMIRAEVEAMLDTEAPRLTVGKLMRLWLARSPFVMGGQLSRADLAAARRIIGADLSVAQISAELATAFRGFEIIQASPRSVRWKPRGGIGPEWLADLYGSVSRSSRLDWDYFLWRLPLAAAAHIAAAAHRAAGGSTERPQDWGAAFSKLKDDEADGREKT